MSEKQSNPPEEAPMSVAEVLGAKYPDPTELTYLSEDELRADLLQHIDQEKELDYQIALLASERKKVRSEMIILQMALTMATDED
jgi:hypothetical protein